VLRRRTQGYRHHPQLQRFRAQPSPLGSRAYYRRGVHAAPTGRGYAFTAQKISPARGVGVIAVTRGQVMYERAHLLRKLETRDPERRRRLARVSRPQPNPTLRIAPGDVEPWERSQGDSPSSGPSVS
jgi:hypothetical protein